MFINMTIDPENGEVEVQSDVSKGVMLVVLMALVEDLKLRVTDDEEEE